MDEPAPPPARLVSDWMTREPRTVREETSLAEALDLMEDHHFRHLPVVDPEGHLVGILSEGDIRGLSPLHERGAPPAVLATVLRGYQARSKMHSRPRTIEPQQSLADAIRLFVRHKLGSLPVVEGRRLVGILTEVDVLRAYLAEIEAGDPG